MDKLKSRFIIIDYQIPYIKGLFENFCNVIYAPANEFKAEIWWVKRHVPNASIALIVRTRTLCNAELLRNSGVDFIATATIGTDHIDLEFCKENNITVFSAAGCNSGGVMQFVFTALALAAKNNHLKLPILERVYNYMFSCSQKKQDITLGVIGVGNVGSKVVDFAQKLGWRIMANDPPKEHLHPEYCSLKELLAVSDIVTLHLPLDPTTQGFANKELFCGMKEGAIIINTSRGEVLDEVALLDSLNLCKSESESPRGKIGGYIVDVWQNEPNINLTLLDNALVATPHIAGYSKEGKELGTQMVVRAVAQYLQIEELSDFVVNPSPSFNILDLNKPVGEQLLSFFEISELDKKLRSAPKEFETLRNEFSLRSEFRILND